jgi:hypothetical protein
MDDASNSFYDYKTNTILQAPNIGFNPDDGIKIGIVAGYIVNDYKQNPLLINIL